MLMIWTNSKPTAALCQTFMFVSLIFLILVLPAPLAVAQDESLTFEAHPLRPADTSSPRDTLRSFISSTNETIQAWRAGASREAVRNPARRVIETFDFSQLPEIGRQGKEFETALLLKEILDRIELPPEEEIPGDEEVADEEKAHTRWTIPNTGITIAKVEEGPRAGEFLFTAKTVAHLDQFYERAKVLPYKPGAAIGIYEDIIHSPGWPVPQSWGAALPRWSKTIVLGEALWQWLGFAIIGVAAFFVIRLLLRWGRRWDKKQQSAGALMRFGLPLSVFVGMGIVFACRFVFQNVFRFIGDLGRRRLAHIPHSRSHSRRHQRSPTSQGRKHRFPACPNCSAAGEPSNRGLLDRLRRGLFRHSPHGLDC
jgi:MscS family membrane protein